MQVGRGPTAVSSNTASFCQAGNALAPAGWHSVLDTSGSISALELAIYTGNLLGIIEETGPQEIILIQSDTEVRRVDYLDPGETFDQIEVEGRGGTRFQPAFDWIAQNADDANIIIYATDLQSSDTPENPGLPVIWLTPTRGKTMPFGTIIHVRP